MNLSMPIIICEDREEITAVLRDMLTKHGFFHLFEFRDETEMMNILDHEDNQFLLLNSKFTNSNIHKMISNRKNFLIFSQPDEEKTIHLASMYGVDHILSFPYSSRMLVEKIGQLMV